MTLVKGQVIGGRYRIVSLLRQGGMGAVYQAWDTRLNVSVALKEMTPQPGLDPNTLAQLRGQFQQEATVMARLNHPHLVDVIDFFEEGGNAYLVMKLIEGESLADWIGREGSLPEAQVLAWAGQLLDALGYCHSRGIIHRDVKPQNVIITPEGQAVLVDFGLLKLWNPRDPRTKTAMRGMGTPEYAPPEQYSDQPGRTDTRSDLYSLGATLYHALTGQAPLTATDRMADPDLFVPLRRLNRRVSLETEAAVLRAMELARGQRFLSTQEMATALGGGMFALAHPARSKHQPTRVMAGAHPALLRRGRVPAWAWVLGAVVILALLVGLWGSRLGSLPEAPTAVMTKAAAGPPPTELFANPAPSPVNTSTPIRTSAVPTLLAPVPTVTPLPAGPFVIDGEPDEWEAVSAAVEDPVGDFIESSEYGTDDDSAGDIKALYVGADVNCLYLIVTFHHPMSREHLVYDVVFFGSSQTSYERYQLRFNRRHRGSLEAWLDTWNEDLVEIAPDPEIKAAVGTVFEMRIPWRALEGQSASIHLHVRTNFEDEDIILPFIDCIDYERPGGVTQPVVATPVPTLLPTVDDSCITVVLQPGAEDGVDAQLPEGFIYNYGRWEWLEVGSDEHNTTLHNSLIKFNLAAHLPVGAVVESAALDLYAVNGWAHQVWVHEVLKEWDEGTGVDDGGPSTYDGATWTHRRYTVPGDSGSGVPWHEAGCSGTGTDYKIEAEDSRNVLSGWNRWHLSPALVQRWLDDPETNYGLVISDHAARVGKVDFASSDYGDPSLWPRLVIQYHMANP